MERRAETQGRRRRRSASRSAMARWTRARSSSPVERHGFPASERWPAPSVRVARCMYDRAGGASLRRGRSPRDLCCVALPGTGPVGRARALQPLAGSPVAQRRVERGRAFETEVLRRLGCLHPGAVVIDIEERSERERATVAAMGGGAPIIIAGRLPTDHSGRRAGEPDMLVRPRARPLTGQSTSKPTAVRMTTRWLESRRLGRLSPRRVPKLARRVLASGLASAEIKCCSWRTTSGGWRRRGSLRPRGARAGSSGS